MHTLEVIIIYAREYITLEYVLYIMCVYDVDVMFNRPPGSHPLSQLSMTPGYNPGGMYS